jgi:hypothetical protein
MGRTGTPFRSSQTGPRPRRTDALSKRLGLSSLRELQDHVAVALAEAALAHTVGDEAERAYRRGDALMKRRELMTAWADWLEGEEERVRAV